MPALAGTQSIITENELRAFGKCPRLFSFGGTDVFPPNVALLKLTVEKVISSAVRKDKLDPMGRHMKSLLQATKELKLKDRYLDGQVQAFETEVGLAIGELFEAFQAHKYLPIFGPTPWKISIARSTVQLETSGILRGPDKTLHFIDFSPYQTLHGFKNDPISYLKLQTVRQFTKPWFKENKIVLHVFSINERGTLLYNKIENLTPSLVAIERIERQVKAMMIGYDSPVLPCNSPCPFKQKCFLETE